MAIDRISVIGAGYAGLIAANMLRARVPVDVYEKQPALPDNHSAVLRCRTEDVATAVGIPMDRVKVGRVVVPHRNPLADVLAYSYKVSGEYRSDRSVSRLNPGEFAWEDRWIPPRDFAGKLAEKLPLYTFNFGSVIDTKDLMDRNRGYPIVSTMPMPLLMGALGYEDQEPFPSESAVHLAYRLPNLWAFATFYDPDPLSYITRLSITGDLIHIECSGIGHSQMTIKRNRQIINRAREITSIGDFNADGPATIETREAPRAKIRPINEINRRRFIAWATNTYGIYSLGRLATWRPSLRLDDLPQDIRWIERMIFDDFAPWSFGNGRNE